MVTFHKKRFSEAVHAKLSELGAHGTNLRLPKPDPEGFITVSVDSLKGWHESHPMNDFVLCWLSAEADNETHYITGASNLIGKEFPSITHAEWHVFYHLKKTYFQRQFELLEKPCGCYVKISEAIVQIAIINKFIKFN
jgi:hypothetical protein